MLYANFALIAIFANLGSQAGWNAVYRGPLAVESSIIFGTATGLFVKYLLDKRYIFHFQTHTLREDGFLFTLYAWTGVLTTGIFWGFEYLFYWIYSNEMMRYFGGGLGLVIGYYIKYRLDCRFVFKLIEPRLSDGGRQDMTGAG